MRIINVEKKIDHFNLKINDLTIEEKKIHGIIGANGSGKSTLLKLISGLLKPDSGIIDYEKLSLRDITITTQRPYLIHDSVYYNLVYPLKLRKQKLSEDEIKKWLNKWGLSGRENQYAPSLSSGERQKLSLARALIFKPKVVLIDETLANLDPDSVTLFEEIIKDIQLREPITWIIVSHQLAQIYKICEQVHFMAEGSIIADGTPKEILNKTGNPVIEKYISSHLIDKL